MSRGVAMSTREKPDEFDPEPGPGQRTGGREGLNSGIQGFIGRQLKAVYADLVNEPIPDVLLKLVDELERKEKGE
jgi:hypothetical protein